LSQGWTKRSQALPLFDELKRRKVFRVAIAYVVVAWVFAQAADLVADNFNAPDWVMQMIIALLIVGLPVSLVLAWAFDLTPEGIIRAQNDDTDLPALSNTLTYSLVGGMLVVVAVILYLIWPSTMPPPPAVAANAIAVLPFANNSAAEENAAIFADGMHDDLLTRLADIKALKVISRTSVMGYRDTTKNMRQIGEELGVTYLLEGRVQRAGNMLHIIIQLIDAESDEHLWQETYDRELTAENIFEIQAEMATLVAATLHQTLSPELTAQLNEQPTQSTRAYDFFLSGNDLRRRGRNDLALKQFERAVEEDPTFAYAWAALSRTHTRKYWSMEDENGTQLKDAIDAADKAFDLVPDLPEAHLAMGDYYLFGFRDFDNALNHLVIAERGMPGSVDVSRSLAGVQRRTGDSDAALITMARAIELDPRNTALLRFQAGTYSGVRNAAQVHYYLDRALEIAPDSAATYRAKLRLGLWLGDDLAELRAVAESIPLTGLAYFAHRILGMFERDYDAVVRFLDASPDDVWGWNSKPHHYAVAYQQAGKPDLALPYFEAAKEELERGLADPDFPENNSRQRMALAEVTAGLGDFDEAVRLAEEAMKEPSDTITAKFLLSEAALGVYVPAGDHGRAIELLDEHFSSNIGWTIEGLLHDPRLDPIRENPRFLALVERYKRP
jgi:TolB-like protein/Tfp pilus assembly protein PilF